MSKEAKILIGILVVVVGSMIALFISAGGPETSTGNPVDDTKLIRSDSHTTGSGAVKVVEFGDFQCPACGAVFPELQRIKQEFASDITFAFRNFPLPQHANAQIAAEAAEAAGAQDKFWEMHDELYEHQTEWESLANPLDKFVDYAREIGVADIDRFKREITANTYSDGITADTNDGNSVGVSSTPTIFVNGIKAANGSYNTIKKMIENAKAGQ
jgi:protein-disulfide isomerase